MARRLVAASSASILVLLAVLVAGSPSAPPAAGIVLVPAGWFVLGDDQGSPDERPARRIWLSAYWIDRLEVTNDQYHAFLVATGRAPPAYWAGIAVPVDAADLPVVGIAWSDACAYCAWRDARLPTEAEWEMACRGAEGRVFPWGDEWKADRANVRAVAVADPDALWDVVRSPASPGMRGLRAVGSVAAGDTPTRIADLAGNAADWVFDWYAGDGYETLPDHDPVGTSPGQQHSVRGSGWYVRGEFGAASASRCANRNASHSADEPRIGFRCASPVGPIEAGGPHCPVEAMLSPSPWPAPQGQRRSRRQPAPA